MESVSALCFAELVTHFVRWRRRKLDIWGYYSCLTGACRPFPPSAESSITAKRWVAAFRRFGAMQVGFWESVAAQIAGKHASNVCPSFFYPIYSMQTSLRYTELEFLHWPVLRSQICEFQFS